MIFLTTIDRYILKSLLKHLITITILIISVVWLSQSLRFLELIVNNNVGIQSYLTLIIFLLPDLISILLPICLLISGVYIYQKFIADNEVAVLRSTGHSNLQIAKPFLIICIGATFFSLYSNIFLVPESFKKFKGYEFQIRNELSSSVIHPGTFNLTRGVTAYIQERSIKGELKGVFIHAKESDTQNGYVITAKSGYLKRENDQLNLILLNGQRQEWTKELSQLSYCSFETFVYDLTEMTSQKEERHIKPYERSLRELLNPEFSKGNLALERRMATEAHQRIILPWICLLNGLILMSILLFGDLRRRHRKRKIFYAITIAGFFQIALIAILNASTNHPFLLPISYALLFLALSFFFVLLAFPKIYLYFKNH